MRRRFRELSQRLHAEVGAMGIPGILFLVYIVLGILVAATNGYFQNLGGIRGIISLVLAILLWPLVLAGIDIRLGRM
ncbi:MAG: hypothetical protein ACRDIX_10625 [Actinomycetota bacterium]